MVATDRRARHAGEQRHPVEHQQDAGDHRATQQRAVVQHPAQVTARAAPGQQEQRAEQAAVEHRRHRVLAAFVDEDTDRADQHLGDQQLPQRGARYGGRRGGRHGGGFATREKRQARPARAVDTDSDILKTDQYRSPRMLLYETIAAGLRRQIAQGTLHAGERLPSVRRLAQAHQVSAATAVQACLQLEREGLVQARPRSGHFVHARPTSLPAAPVSRRQAPGKVANPALQRLLELPQRPGLMHLHAAVPDPSLLPHAALSAALSRTLRRRPAAALDYAPSPGDPALRRQIALRYEHTGTAMTADEIVITAGATEALSLALRVAASPGDVVLVETPTYYGILQAVAALGLKVLEVPNRLDRGIDVARLDRLLQQTPVRVAILVPNFSNPTGSLTSDADKQALLASCARHGTVVIEDDIYGELAWSGQRPLPLRHWDTSGNVITCGSFSKTLAPGLRVGWLAGGAWTEALGRAKYFSSSCNASLPQMALGEYLARHGLERHLRRLRRAVAWYCSMPPWPQASAFHLACCSPAAAITATACA
jgi:DNA-binding transcriptional MocR family regulator